MAYSKKVYVILAYNFYENIFLYTTYTYKRVTTKTVQVIMNMALTFPQ